MNNIGDIFEIKNGALWRKAFVDNAGRCHRPRPVKLKSNTGKNGYCRVMVHRINKKVMYHRIVWELVHGSIPEGYEIDHINGKRLDNRIENLRLVTDRQNAQNRKLHRKNKLYGCHYNKRKNKWQAQCQIKSRKFHLGYYNTEIEAHDAYKKFVEERGIS